MLRDIAKLGLVTAVGLGVVATVGVGVGVATLVAGVIFAGVSSAEPPRNETSNEGSKPKVEQKKSPKQGKPTLPYVPPQEKRPSETTKRQPSTDTALDSKFGRSSQGKTSAPIVRDERTTNFESKSDRAPENNYPSPSGRDERKVPTPTPNRPRSSSVVVNKHGGATSSSKEDGPHVGSSNGTALPADKPSSLSRELEAQIAPEVQHWRFERLSNQETKKRGTASGHGINEKPSSTALAAKTATVAVPEPSASVIAPGPLPLFPPSPIPQPKSTPHLGEAILESQTKPELTAVVLHKEEKHAPGISQDELSVPTDRLPVPLIGSKLDMSPPLRTVPAQDSRSETPVSLLAESQRHPDVPSLSTAPVVANPVEFDFGSDVILVATASTLLPPSSKIEAEPLDTPPTTTVTNGLAPNGSGISQGPAWASRDSLVSVQRRNSKLASAAKKVSHSVKKVFKGTDGKVIHSDPQRLTSSSSDSVDSQRFTSDHEQALLNGRALSKLVSPSRESVASTKSRRSFIDGTKKGFKRMFRGSDSDNIDIPPVPPLPSVTVPEASISSEKPAVVPSATLPAPKPPKSFSSKRALPGQQHQQQAHASVSDAPQSTRNAPGVPDAGNNASPLLKGMFKGRANTRVRR